MVSQRDFGTEHDAHTRLAFSYVVPTQPIQLPLLLGFDRSLAYPSVYLGKNYPCNCNKHPLLVPECSFTLPRYVTFYNLPLCFSDPHVSIASADQVGALEQDGRAVEGRVPSDTLRRCLSCSS